MLSNHRLPSLNVSLFMLFFGLLLLLQQNLTSSNRFLEFDFTPKFPRLFSFQYSQQKPQKHTLDSWIRHLQSSSPDSQIRTNRTACREFFSGGQSCVFDGLTCLDLRPWAKRNSHGEGRIPVIFINEDEPDGKRVPHDRWCHLKHITADPRNGGSRVWNVEEWTVAPRWSCLDAEWRSWKSLKKQVRNIKFVNEALWIVDLDYIGGTHNNHLLKDYVWILDLILWQKSLQLPPDKERYFPEQARHIVFPGTVKDFLRTMSKDINRLVWALQLQLDLERLYGSNGKVAMKRPQFPHSEWRSSRNTLSTIQAYPEIFKSERMMFHKDLVIEANDTETWNRMIQNKIASENLPPAVKKNGLEKNDLLCSPQLVAGAKLPGYGHERVCHQMRMRSWALYGIREPNIQHTGVLVRPPAPKRIVILNRSLSRTIMNASILLSDLRAAFEPYGVEVELITTRDVQNAEANVRAYARAGVLISPHGSQSMSLMFMPRFSAIIEVYPFAYRHYAFKFAAESCQIFHFEVYGRPHPSLTQEDYDYCLRTAGPLEMSACARGPVKFANIPIASEPIIEKAFLAFAKIGHDFREVKL